MKYCCLAFTWRAKVSLSQLSTSVNSSLFTLCFCGNIHQKSIADSEWPFTFCCRARLMFWNCQTRGKTGFPLVSPYLIISDSPIAFHFHCVNPGNPSAPNDQLVTWQQRHFGCHGLELSVKSLIIRFFFKLKLDSVKDPRGLRPSNHFARIAAMSFILPSF